MSSKEVELAWLVGKVKRDENFVTHALEFYQLKHQLWSPHIQSAFRDMIERKKDQLHYEYTRIEKLGWLIAGGREDIKLDI